MSPNVLLRQLGGSRISGLVVGKPLVFCARFLADQVSVVPRGTIKALDRIPRHILGIHEFSREPGCVLRYSRTRSTTAITMPSGEAVRLGDPILELHFWNDRLGSDRYLRSSPVVLRSAFRRSLALLAQQLRSNQHFADIKAVHATLARIPSRSCRVHRPFGCALYVESGSSARWIHDFFENFLVHSLRWAFNPNRAKQRPLRLRRLELWMAASDLTARFGEGIRPNIAWAMVLDELRPSEQYMPEATETVKASGD